MNQIRREPDGGTFLTAVFRATAEGRRVRVDDSEPSPYGKPGLYYGDVDFILGENTTRRHDDLMAATVLEKVAAVVAEVVDRTILEPVKDRIEAPIDLVRDILALTKRLGAFGKARTGIRKGKIKARKTKKRNRRK